MQIHLSILNKREVDISIFDICFEISFIRIKMNNMKVDKNRYIKLDITYKKAKFPSNIFIFILYYTLFDFYFIILLLYVNYYYTLLILKILTFVFSN